MPGHSKGKGIDLRYGARLSNQVPDPDVESGVPVIQKAVPVFYQKVENQQKCDVADRW